MILTSFLSGVLDPKETSFIQLIHKKKVENKLHDAYQIFDIIFYNCFKVGQDFGHTSFEGGVLVYMLGDLALQMKASYEPY